MDFLQIVLIFLIILVAIFLAISGFQVFFILRDLHKSLRRLDKILETSQGIATGIEKPVKAVSNLATVAGTITGVVKGKLGKPQNRRFYKRVL